MFPNFQHNMNNNNNLLPNILIKNKALDQQAENTY